MTDAEPSLTAVRVWDLPTRAFHWLLAADRRRLRWSAPRSAATPWSGTSASATWCSRCWPSGVLWGLVGGRWSRFASFIYAPGTVLRYLRGAVARRRTPRRRPQPAGQLFGVRAAAASWRVQVGTRPGGRRRDRQRRPAEPLRQQRSLAARPRSWHKDCGQWILLALVALHVGGHRCTTCWRARRTWCGPWSSATSRCRQARRPAPTAGATRLLALLVAACAPALRGLGRPAWEAEAA